MSPKLNGMFVTPKDIDETVKRLAGLLSEGINMAFQTMNMMTIVNNFIASNIIRASRISFM